MAHDWSLRATRSKALFEALKARQQKSWLMLKREAVAIDLFGNILDPLSITTYSFWAWGRVAELMFRDFKPPEIMSPNKE